MSLSLQASSFGNLPSECLFKCFDIAEMLSPVFFAYKMRETTQKNEACFDAQRSRLHWHLKQASFAIEAIFIFYPKNVNMSINENEWRPILWIAIRINLISWLRIRISMQYGW